MTTQSDLGYSVKVHGYNDTLFAAKPAWATAAVVFENTFTWDDIPAADPHNISGHLYAKILRSDPFQTPFFFATEADARAAVKAIEGLELVAAVNRIEALRATSARTSK
jgi:hypothetical protein